jgi:hypothetical protein
MNFVHLTLSFTSYDGESLNRSQIEINQLSDTYGENGKDTAHRV